MSDAPTVRVRFAPSPTGYLHVGGARTVLFNWLLARKSAGTFILRIEDTDQARNVADSVHKILSDLRWLGLLWDEGPEIGGPCGPYYQSQRLDTYRRYADRLLAARRAYYAWESPEQLQALRDAAKSRPGGFRYPRPDPLPTVEQGEEARRAGKPVVVRLLMPDRGITVVDDILGNVTLAADQMEDFVILKSDGFPTYHFACVVDDELMGVTHVLRGQEHLMNTPRHIALQQALGFRTPRYAHLPVIFNMDGSKMSKRDKEKALKSGLRPPEIDVHDFRRAGYLPEALLNFLALLGWSAGDDREFYALDELTAAFSLERIGKTNARFDREKLLSFNTAWAARLAPPRLRAAFRDFLAVNASDHADTALAAQPDEVIDHLLRACAGFRTFEDIIRKAGSLFIPDEALSYDPKAVNKVLLANDRQGVGVLEKLAPLLHAHAEWSVPALEEFVKTFGADRGLPIGAVAQPIRVAVTGGTISPAIADTLALLGRDRALARLSRCLHTIADSTPS